MTISSTKVIDRPKKEESKPKPTKLKAIIAAEVLRMLGTPKSFNRIEVSDGVEERGVGRVDIWCNTEEGSKFPQQRVKYSFYLCVTSEGEIVSSNPPIEKL